VSYFRKRREKKRMKEVAERISKLIESVPLPKEPEVEIKPEHNPENSKDLKKLKKVFDN